MGVGADGDSKFRKYFNHRFMSNTPQAGRNRVTVPYESFEYVSVVEKMNDIEIPTHVSRLATLDEEMEKSTS